MPASGTMTYSESFTSLYVGWQCRLVWTVDAAYPGAAETPGAVGTAMGLHGTWTVSGVSQMDKRSWNWSYNGDSELSASHSASTYELDWVPEVSGPGPISPNSLGFCDGLTAGFKLSGDADWSQPVIHMQGQTASPQFVGGDKPRPGLVQNLTWNITVLAVVAVGGLPDAFKGEVVKAYVVCRSGMCATEEDILVLCREHLAAYKLPSAVQFVNDLPKTSSGKIQGRVLRTLEPVQSDLLADVADASASELLTLPGAQM